MIFSPFDELPQADIVLEELADSSNKGGVRQPCGASLILKTINMSGSLDSALEVKEAEEVEITKATVEGLKDEGIDESALVLIVSYISAHLFLY
ncbi:hypothetical protein CDL15_Pgr006985 [Punica granatum]|uniref:Uncharacterized protein n=1 Tax=Punica granatum TaxID=22663 RepID=A0A218X7L3_PUNGR|nr:hypothetical protein CDL15_Pgr006985 [Punica granatum]